MTCWKALATLFTISSFASVASAQDASPASAWIQPDGDAEVGQGFFMTGARGCVLVTAGHVVDSAQTVRWAAEGLSGTGRVIFAKVDLQVGLDIAIVDRLNPTPRRCPGLQPLSQISSAVSNRGAEVFKTSPTGRRIRIEVTIKEDNPELVLRPAYPDEDIKAGTSGAPVRIANVIVGIVKSVDNAGSYPSIGIQRLDRVPSVVMNWLASQPLRPAAASDRFNEDLLPADIRDVVRQGRRMRETAERNSQEALRVEREADKAAALGSSAAAGNAPYGNFINDEEDLEYTGQLRISSGGSRAAGYGASRVRKGNQIGRLIKCGFSFIKNGACDSIGVTVFEDVNPLARWEGPICPGTVFCGPGVLRFRSTEIWWYDPTRKSAGVGELPDQQTGERRRFEGMFENGFWNGPGVLWNADGTILYIGIWKDSKLVAIRNTELKSGRTD